MRFAALVPSGGAVLDLACGAGRHARLFASRGHPVTAVDRDIAPVDGLAGVEAIQADLEDGSPWPLGDRRFAGVVVTNYLYRPLFPAICAAVAPDGVLIYETFMAGHERFGKPSNPAFLLRQDELLALTKPLSVIAFEQGLDPAGPPARPMPLRRGAGPAMRQRICAIRGAPVLL
jgi:SAM-dependent methyltransferase